MRVETVGFVSRVRFPDGKVETSISLKNTHHKLSYEITVDVKSQIVTVKSLKSPYWAMLVPMHNCSFIHLGKPGVNTAKVKPTKAQFIEDEEIPSEPVLASQKRKMRPRPRKNP
jgi:hypothetical protein